MLRDPRRASRTLRLVVALVAASLAAATGCGIKGPLKRPDAAAAGTPSPVPPTTPPDPTLPVK